MLSRPCLVKLLLKRSKGRESTAHASCLVVRRWVGKGGFPVMVIACYLPIGGGIMLLCQLAVAVSCSLIAAGLLATSRARLRQAKYWIALATSAQPIPLFFLLREI